MISESEEQYHEEDEIEEEYHEESTTTPSEVQTIVPRSGHIL